MCTCTHMCVMAGTAKGARRTQPFTPGGNFIEGRLPWQFRICTEENFAAFIQVCTLKQNFSAVKYRTHSNEPCNFLTSFYEEGSCLCLSPLFASYVLFSILHSLLP